MGDLPAHQVAHPAADEGEVAKRSGLRASTLRYYEEKGLIQSVGQPGERRRFAPGVMDQLALIALGQSAGFSLLDDIRSMFLPGGKPNIDRQLLSSKADELDTMVNRLKAMSNGLRHAAACPAESHAQCPSFQRLLKAAADGALERQQRRSAQPVVGLRRPRA